MKCVYCNHYLDQIEYCTLWKITISKDRKNYRNCYDRRYFWDLQESKEIKEDFINETEMVL